MNIESKTCSQKMSTYSISEEGSEANVDEELLRDLDNLREVLAGGESAGKDRILLLPLAALKNGRHVF